MLKRETTFKYSHCLSARPPACLWQRVEQHNVSWKIINDRNCHWRRLRLPLLDPVCHFFRITSPPLNFCFISRIVFSAKILPIVLVAGRRSNSDKFTKWTLHDYCFTFSKQIIPFIETAKKRNKYAKHWTECFLHLHTIYWLLFCTCR